MNFNEKKLYHQIHPLKLCTDISTGLLTTYLLWAHNVVWFLLLFLLPSVIISLLLVKFADLEKQKNSAFGNYISKYMTANFEAIRITGQIMMWIAAWFHLIVFIIIGFIIIIGGWLNGLMFKRAD